MSQYSRSHHSKKVKAVLDGPSKPAEGVDSTTRPSTIKRRLYIFLGSPWHDYDYIQDLDPGFLGKHKKAFFRIANVRQFHCVDVQQQSRIFSSIQHPNVASIYGIYWTDHGQTFLVTEHLSICISQFEIQKHELQEWEIATIISDLRVKQLSLNQK
jgi:hypothetical protein